MYLKKKIRKEILQTQTIYKKLSVKVEAVDKSVKSLKVLCRLLVVFTEKKKNK